MSNSINTQTLLNNFNKADWRFEYSSDKGSDIDSAIDFLEKFDFTTLNDLDLDINQDLDVDENCELLADSVAYLALSQSGKSWSIDDSVSFQITI